MIAARRAAARRARECRELRYVRDGPGPTGRRREDCAEFAHVRRRQRVEDLTPQVFVIS